MRSHEIAREAWQDFCDSFSRLHEGWRVTVEVGNGDGGEKRALVRDGPFLGITAELNVDGEDSVQVMAGDEPEGRVVHNIHRVARIWLDQTDDGADQAIRVETTLGAETAVRFHSTVTPEMLDGI